MEPRPAITPRTWKVYIASSPPSLLIMRSCDPAFILWLGRFLESLFAWTFWWDAVKRTHKHARPIVIFAVWICLNDCYRIVHIALHGIPAVEPIACLFVMFKCLVFRLSECQCVWSYVSQLPTTSACHCHRSWWPWTKCNGSSEIASSAPSGQRCKGHRGKQRVAVCHVDHWCFVWSKVDEWWKDVAHWAQMIIPEDLFTVNALRLVLFIASMFDQPMLLSWVHNGGFATEIAH